MSFRRSIDAGKKIKGRKRHILVDTLGLLLNVVALRHIRHRQKCLGDNLKHVPMSDDYQRIELITGTARRRRWTTEQKLRITEASCEPGESVSSVARRHGVAPNLLYRWRRLMAQGGAAA